MIRRVWWMAGTVVVMGIVAACVAATGPGKAKMKPELAIGAKLIDFSLVGTDGKTYSTETYKDKKVLVVIFSCNTCPYVVAYQDRMIALQKDYGEKGVQLVVINPNRADFQGGQESMAAMKKRAEEKKFPFPYVKDETQEVARAYGARVTPHVYVFGQDRTLIYRGTVDDNWRKPDEVKDQYLRDAIEAGLAGFKPITKAIGCTIKWKS